MGNKYPYTFPPHLQLQQSLQEQPKRKIRRPLGSSPNDIKPILSPGGIPSFVLDALQVPLKPKLGRQGCLPASKLENTTMESRLQLLCIFFFFFLFYFFNWNNFGKWDSTNTPSTDASSLSKSASPPLALLLQANPKLQAPSLTSRISFQPQRTAITT